MKKQNIKPKTNLEELEEYAKEQKTRIPKNVKKACVTADKLGIQVICRLNIKGTDAKGCENATNVRNILLKSEKDTPLYNELKTMFLNYKLADKEEPLLVMVHFRANRLLDLKKLKETLKEKGFKVSESRFVKEEELKQFGNVKLGQITPLTSPALRGIDDEKTKSIIHIFDNDLMKSYSAKKTMTTNALDRQWMIEFNIEQFIDQFKKKYTSTITNQSVVLQGPSKMLGRLEDFIEQELGFVVNGNEDFQERIKQHIFKKITSLKERAYSLDEGHVVASLIPIQYAGIFSNPLTIASSNPTLDLSMSLDRFWHTEVLPQLTEELVRFYEAEVTRLIVDCNILSGILDKIFSERENQIQTNFKELLAKENQDVSFEDLRNQIQYISKGQAIKEELENNIVTSENTANILLLGGSQVSENEWSIYRSQLTNTDNPKLMVLPHEHEQDDAFTIDEAIYRVNDHNFDHANRLLFQVLRNNLEKEKVSHILIASTSLVNLYEKQDGNLLDIKQAGFILKELKEQDPSLNLRGIKKFIKDLNSGVKIINSSEVYAKYVVDKLFF